MEHFAGRTDELAMLEAEWRAVRAGQPRVVLVEGEAGAGKSSLLARFGGQHPDVCLLRASGDETEMLLDWGVTDQLLASAGSVARGGSPRAGTARPNGDGPLAVGAQLVAVLGDLQAGDRVVLVVVDDLHWCDQLSAQALLFALRRMQADRVLGLISARPDELSRLGERWGRFGGGGPPSWWSWPGHSALATCRSGPRPSCLSTPAATRCIAGPCSKSSAQAA